MSTNPSDLQAILDRIEAGKRLSQKELQLLLSGAIAADNDCNRRLGSGDRW
jgi:hypothetical protein